MLDTKKILANNLSALLATRSDVSRLELARQMKVGDGTLGNIKYGKGNPTVEVLEQIAKFFSIEAWQLLAPNLGLKGHIEGYVRSDAYADDPRTALQVEAKLQRLQDLEKIIQSRDAGLDERMEAIVERTELEKYIQEEVIRRQKTREERDEIYRPFALRTRPKI